VIGYDLDGSKYDRAVRVGKHMSYQLLEEMTDWEEGMDKLLMALPILGCMFKKTYFDSVKGTNASDVVWPKDLVVNYWASSIENAQRITHVIELSSNEVVERVRNGIYLDVDLSTTKYEDMPSSGSVSNEAVGLEGPGEQDDTWPYTLLEQHCYLDLDEDGYKEPYIATVDLGSSKVVRIVARFTEDSVVYNDKKEISSITPFHYFTKYSFIPSPDGSFYDIGFGVLLGPINNSINTLINQLTDAGTISVTAGGFIAKGIRISGGEYSFKPNEWKFVNSTGDDLRKGIFPMPVREPSSVLFQLLNLMIQSGERLSSVTETLMGDIPGQNTKATVAMAAIEQGMKVFSSIYKRVHRSLSKEYKKIFKLNELYLPEESYFAILDVGQEQAATIKNGDYSSTEVDISPSSDPTVATEEQRMAKVQVLMELLQLGTVNPAVVTKRYLEATEQPNIEELMEMPEQGPPPELQFEMEKFKAEMELEQARLKLDTQKVETDGMLKIAQAESAEIGQQIDLYMAKLEELKAKLGMAKELRKDDEDRVRGMEKSSNDS
jgi:chaperonin GroES